MQTTQSVNAAALAAAFRRDAPQMTGLATRLLREADVPECAVGAEDVVQTAFEKALRVQEVLVEPRAYVYAILRREVSSWAVRLGRERQWETARLAELRTSPAHGRDVGATVTDRVIVRDGIRQLPGQQAAALVATKMYGFTQDETAQLTGRRPGTVAVHVARAVAKLLLYLTPVVFIVFLGLWWGFLEVLPWLAVGAASVMTHLASARPSPPCSPEEQKPGKYRAGRAASE
ncbi:RNA polymerase sigma factor [Streptomyces luteogriseus]|uniref:RNA polymerase sigma factor n=1 Tax=Streptomyces luteogriseus TaxID=68233 RepID=UPI0027D83B8C|nr:RNA polymerase sigma factor [Streptomyces luteogriseus]